MSIFLFHASIRHIEYIDLIRYIDLCFVLVASILIYFKNFKNCFK